MYMTTLTQQLDKIGADIISVLEESKLPLTQAEIYQNSKLKNLSSHGWSFALERLERNHKIEFVGRNEWRLKPIEDQIYIHLVEEYTNQKVLP